MAERESRESRTERQNGKHGPPELEFPVKVLRDLKAPSKRWSELDQTIDILLLTVNTHGFLCCFQYLQEVFKSSNSDLGFVFFGKMGEREREKLQVALLQCCLLYTSPSPRDLSTSRMPSSA